MSAESSQSSTDFRHGSELITGRAPWPPTQYGRITGAAHCCPNATSWGQVGHSSKIGIETFGRQPSAPRKSATAQKSVQHQRSSHGSMGSACRRCDCGKASAFSLRFGRADAVIGAAIKPCTEIGFARDANPDDRTGRRQYLSLNVKFDLDRGIAGVSALPALIGRA